MGYNARNDEIRDNVTRMRREWEAQRGALTTVRRFNATPSAKGYGLVLAQDCSRVHFKTSLVDCRLRQLRHRVDLDLSVKPRDSEDSIRTAPRRTMSALQWTRKAAHHCVSAASVDLKSQRK